MQENHVRPAHQVRAIGYALNVFAYDTLAELWPVLEGDVLAIKERAFPDASLTWACEKIGLSDRPTAL